jgi:hypothetical protein
MTEAFALIVLKIIMKKTSKKGFNYIINMRININIGDIKKNNLKK